MERTSDTELTQSQANSVFGGADYSKIPFSLCISDPQLDDNPLVYVSRRFEELTGYKSSSALGRNCRFLQGEKSNPHTVAKIREGLKEGREVSVDLYNYRANGEGFWNRLVITPIHQDGKIRYFVAIANEVSEGEHNREEPDKLLAELQHRVKNHLSMVVSMIRLQAREAQSPEDQFSTLATRVEALQLLYQELSDAGIARHNDDHVPLGAYVSRVAAAVSYASGREAIRLNIDTEQINASAQVAGQIGLILSELMTNSLQHAFRDQTYGVIEVSLRKLANGVVRLRVSDDGAGIAEDVDWPKEGNLGAKIVTGLIKDLAGKLSVDRGATGTTVTLDVTLS